MNRSTAGLGSETKVHFDASINLGHILTFIGFVVTIFIGWTNLDKRVVTLEEGRQTQYMRDQHQDKILSSESTQIRESLNDIKAALIRLDNKVEKLK